MDFRVPGEILSLHESNFPAVVAVVIPPECWRDYRLSRSDKGKNRTYVEVKNIFVLFFCVS